MASAGGGGGGLRCTLMVNQAEEGRPAQECGRLKAAQAAPWTWQCTRPADRAEGCPGSTGAWPLGRMHGFRYPDAQRRAHNPQARACARNAIPPRSQVRARCGGRRRVRGRPRLSGSGLDPCASPSRSGDGPLRCRLAVRARVRQPFRCLRLARLSRTQSLPISTKELLPLWSRAVFSPFHGDFRLSHDRAHHTDTHEHF